MKTAASLLAAAGLAMSLNARAVLIGFEEFGNVGLVGPTIDSQYAGVIFSSTAGNVNKVTSQLGIGFGQNFLCTAITTLNCAGDTTLTFSVPVTGLTFYAVGSNNAGATARVDILVGGTLFATRDIVTNGIFATPNLVDLSSFDGISAIRLHVITDAGGLGWDNFNFAPIPEPGTFGILGAGAALMCLAAPRRALPMARHTANQVDA